MKPSHWLIKLTATSLLLLGIPIGSVMAFNYYIDPNWTFTHAHDNNDMQRGFNERQQKTNWINAQNHFKYDAIMIGTSRTTYINSEQFSAPLFNYSLSNLHITEYPQFLQYAKDKNEQPFQTVYVELTITSYDGNIQPSFTESDSFFSQAEDPFLKYSSLFSQETFEHAKLNYEMSKNDASDLPRIYDRNLQVSTTYKGKDLEQRLAVLKRQLASRDESKPNWMSYRDDFKPTLQEIKAMFPTAQIVPFSDLIWSERLTTYIQHPQVTPAYKRYVTDIVDTFGQFYSFHQYNETTMNEANFFDLYHFYPAIGDDVAAALQQPTASELVYIVTKDNLDEYFKSLGI